MSEHPEQQHRGVVDDKIGVDDNDDDDIDDVDIVHMNHAGASPSPRGVVDRIVRHLREEQRLGGYSAVAPQSRSGRLLSRSYQSVAQLVNAPDWKTEIALVESATVAWTRLFYAFVEAAQQQQYRECVRQHQQQRIAAAALMREKEADNNNKKKKAKKKKRRDYDSTTTTTTATASRVIRNTIYVSQAEYAANLVAACQFATRRSHSLKVAGGGNGLGGLEDDDLDVDDLDEIDVEIVWTVRMIPSTTTTTTESGDQAGSEGGGGGGASSAPPTATTTTGVVDVDAFREMLYRDGYDSDVDEDDDDSDEDGPLPPPEDFLSMSIACVTHVPTNSGIVNPVEEIGRVISEYNSADTGFRDDDGGVSDDGASGVSDDGTSDDGGAFTLPRVLYLVDACQSVGQMPVDVQAIRCHGLVATGRKYLRGPRGTGFLYVKESLLRQSDHDDDPHNTLWPDHVDHYCVPVSHVPDPQNVVDYADSLQDVLSYGPRPGAQRFEFWESNVANKLGLGEAVAHALGVGLEEVAVEIRTLARHLYARLRSIRTVHMHHPPSSGLVTFWVEGIDAADVQERLWEPTTTTTATPESQPQRRRRFEVSAVPATSTPLDSSLTGVPDLVRASVSYTNTVDDVDAFIDRLVSIIAEHHNVSSSSCTVS